MAPKSMPVIQKAFAGSRKTLSGALWMKYISSMKISRPNMAAKRNPSPTPAPSVRAFSIKRTRHTWRFSNPRTLYRPNSRFRRLIRNR